MRHILPLNNYPSIRLRMTENRGADNVQLNRPAVHGESRRTVERGTRAGCGKVFSPQVHLDGTVGGDGASAAPGFCKPCGLRAAGIQGSQTPRGGTPPARVHRALPSSRVRADPGSEGGRNPSTMSPRFPCLLRASLGRSLPRLPLAQGLGSSCQLPPCPPSLLLLVSLWGRLTPRSRSPLTSPRRPASHRFLPRRSLFTDSLKSAGVLSTE